MAIYNQNAAGVRIFPRFSALTSDLAYVGYAALIAEHSLKVPDPDTLCAAGRKSKKDELKGWRLYGPRYRPDNTLLGHLTFALKYEGIDLAVLKSLFDQLNPEDVASIVRSEPTGAYSRRIWFLFEWLTNTQLNIEDARQGNFVPLVNNALQYAASPRNSRRHRVRNNLPGTQAFCPLIRRTEKLDRLMALDLSQTAADHIGKTHPDLLLRAAAFLLLKDSRASYTIEGEKPPHKRIERWGRIIGEAGQRKLNIEELEHLQSIVIPDNRFTTLGCRTAGGFVGAHDRSSNTPLPEHISARPDDLASLLSGLIDTYELLVASEYDAVLTAAIIAFGFVFIHPFEDGNGRIHRYLFHHVLAEKGFVPKGLVFPVSAVILDRIEDYRRSLEHFSKPRLDHIEWRPTASNNVEVLNATADLYRYFDATKQAEFLFECVEITINQTLLEEVDYLSKYDEMNSFVKEYIEMPDKLIDLLIRFLDRQQGILSKRARSNEFAELTDAEVITIQHKYEQIFNRD